jgi:hypothetical protein
MMLVLVTWDWDANPESNDSGPGFQGQVEMKQVWVNTG